MLFPEPGSPTNSTRHCSKFSLDGVGGIYSTVSGGEDQAELFGFFRARRLWFPRRRWFALGTVSHPLSSDIFGLLAWFKCVLCSMTTNFDARKVTNTNNRFISTNAGLMGPSCFVLHVEVVKRAFSPLRCARSGFQS